MREIINNFLPRNEFLGIRDQILNESFPWLLFNKDNAGNMLCEERFNFQMVHIFYQAPITISKYIDVINPLVKKNQ